MINLDPGIVDQNRVRKDKRKRLFRTMLLPLIILFVVAIIFLRPGIYNIVMSISYDNKNYGVSESISNMQTMLNPFEAYIADYNRGVANLRLAHYEQAEADFESSLTKNPPAEMLCKIYINLSYSIEMQADKLAARGTYDKSIELYNRAESILFSNGCAARGNGAGKDRNADKAKERVGEKREGAARDMAGEMGEEEGDGGSDNPLSEDSLGKIRENNKDDSSTQQDLRNRTGRIHGEGSGSSGYSKVKHW